MIKRATAFLFLIILAELALGGGGRLTAVGPVSLRMVLFGLAIIFTMIHIFGGAEMDKNILRLLAAFTLMLCVGVLTGMANNAEIKLLWEDVKPLMFFYALPFFSFAVRRRIDLEKIGKVITISASILAIGYFIVLFLIHSGTIKFLDFYNLVVSTEEFFFRGEIAFFYKGFLFLCIGFLFSHLFFEKKYWALMALLFAALVLTFTRGFFLALTLTYVFFYFIINKQRIKVALGIILSILIAFAGKDIYAQLSSSIHLARSNTATSPEQSTTTLLGDREYSDNQRILQAKQVFAAITPSSMWIGHGFGRGIPARPVHMEVSYLEIFHKQGLFGLGCWTVLLISLFTYYKEASRVDPKWSAVFLLISLIVLFQSLTNQYINNPIGLGVLMVSLVSFRAIKYSGR